jgi:hypothetical protein
MDPAALVGTVMDAVEAGEYEVLADETSIRLKAGLSGPTEALNHNLPTTKPWKNGSAVIMTWVPDHGPYYGRGHSLD